MSTSHYLSNFPSPYNPYEENSYQSGIDLEEEESIEDSYFLSNNGYTKQENKLSEALKNMPEKSQETEENIQFLPKKEECKQMNKIPCINNQATNAETYSIFHQNYKQIIQPLQFNYIPTHINLPKCMNKNDSDSIFLSKKRLFIEDNKTKNHQIYKGKYSQPLINKKTKQKKENIKKEKEIKKVFFFPNMKDKKFEDIYQEKGRPSQMKIYLGDKTHDSKEILNATKKISLKCNYEVHDFCWNFIKSEIKEKNIEINLNQGVKYCPVEIKLKKLNKDKEIISDIINIVPPSITKLISAKKLTEEEKEKEFAPYGKYHDIDGYINKCQEAFNENLITLYSEYSCPKNTKKSEEEKLIKNELEKSKKRREIYKLKIKEFLNFILKTENNKENKPINYLFNLRFEKFMKIFMRYEDAQEIEKEICKHLYGGKKQKLEGFKVYDDYKHEFSSDANKQENYRNHIFGIIEETIKKRKKKEKN